MYVLGIDLGTNSVKALILELETGQIAGIGQRGYGYIEGTEASSTAEQDRGFVWSMVVRAVQESISTSGIDVRMIKAAGLSGQMHGTVLYNQVGDRVSNIITWEDGRCSRDVLDEIASIGGEEINKSGCGIATGFLGPTVYEILRHSNIEIGHVLLPTDWLRQELTGEKTFLTDHSNGSSTGFFDTQNRDWNYSLIDRLGLSADIFPKVASTTALGAGISRSTAEAIGLIAGTSVTIGGGDQPLSMIGSGICDPSGGVLLNIGTGSQVSKVGEWYCKAKNENNRRDAEERRGKGRGNGEKGRGRREIPSSLLSPPSSLRPLCDLRASAVRNFTASGEYRKETETIVFCFPERGFSLLGAALSGGAALKWWRTVSEGCARMYSIDIPEGNIYREMDRWAAEVPPGADGLTFIPYLSGTRSQPELTASFTGLTRRHSYAHFTRAILEGVVFELYYLYEKVGPLRDDAPMIAAGGGFSSRLWTQIAADIFGREIKTTQGQEQAAVGAALVAGVGIGYYQNMREACGKVKYKPEIVKPRKENVEKYRKIYETQYRQYLNEK